MRKRSLRGGHFVWLGYLVGTRRCLTWKAIKLQHEVLHLKVKLRAWKCMSIFDRYPVKVYQNFFFCNLNQGVRCIKREAAGGTTVGLSAIVPILARPASGTCNLSQFQDCLLPSASPKQPTKQPRDVSSLSWAISDPSHATFTQQLTKPVVRRNDGIATAATRSPRNIRRNAKC